MRASSEYVRTFQSGLIDLFMPNCTFTVALPLIVSIVCGVSLTCTAQLLEHFSSEKLKGYTRVLVTSRNLDQKEGTKYKSIYSITPRGDVFKKEDYEQNKLVGWEVYDYNDDGKLRSRIVHGQIFGYSEKTERDTVYLSEDHYHGYLYEYNGKFLTSVVSISCSFGSKSIDGVKKIEYDRQGRKVTEVDIDSTIGWHGTFLPNSAILDTLYEKKEASKTTTRHTWSGNKISSTTRNDKGEVEGYEITELNIQQKPVLKKEKDANQRDLRWTSFHYDEKGRLIKEKIELLNLELITFDVTSADEEEIRYNSSSLPIRMITREKGKVISETTIEYQ